MSRWFFIAAVSTVLLASSVGARENSALRGGVDYTKRNTEFQPAPMTVPRHQWGRVENLNNKRFSVSQREVSLHPMGERRARIDMRETREKNLIRPSTREVEVIPQPMALPNRRMAYLRNLDQVRENNLVPAFRDADVVTVMEMSRPDEAPREASMRDLNRFSFQRNHSEKPGVDKQEAGSETGSQK